MKVAIGVEYLKRHQNETVVKELSLAAANLSVTLRFESPYDMMPYAWDENGLNWDYGHISYHKLFTVVSEAVAGIAHIY